MEARQAQRVYRAQRAPALMALGALGVLLFGLPVLLDLLPAWDNVRLLGIPLSWIAIVAVPFPAMVAISHWQLRRAERAEEPE
ncbi:hypothetical protein [Actinokineospora globicatena]|uniref:hypothetical protein n=1 Tax=Actinokineospora globicatena TaxID=103729 RepID=UPI0027E36D80|nr:hypothetical protein [Actinokineospora globicatena]